MTRHLGDTINPTLVTVPCFSGAPWDLPSLTPLAHRPLRTFRFPEEIDSVEGYADALAAQVSHLEEYVLIGDSFGAVVALALAVRRPSGLRALVMSGGFAADPLTTPLAKARVAAARLMPRPLYRSVTLRSHAQALASPHDGEGQMAWSAADTRRLFLENTPHVSYRARTRAAFAADYRLLLPAVAVPALILTPSNDALIGPAAARVLRDGIPDAIEVVLPRTGHMFRFTHPVSYAGAVEDFLESRLPQTHEPSSIALATLASRAKHW